MTSLFLPVPKRLASIYSGIASHRIIARARIPGVLNNRMNGSSRVSQSAFAFDSMSGQIVRNTRDAVIFADKDGVIRLWNGGAEEIFGYKEEEALGRTLDLIIPESLRTRHWGGYHRVMDTGQTKYGKDVLAVPAVRKDGTRISLEFTVALIHDESGTLSGVAAIIRDVTARWQADKELKQRLATLEAQTGARQG